MRTLATVPPNFAAIHKAFNVRGKPIIYAYGDTIYNPQRIKVSDHLIAHEGVHATRQRLMGGPEKWWERYIADPQFRLAEEVPAHAAEYAYFSQRMPHGSRLDDISYEIAHRLASPLYGSLVGIDEARRLILHGQEGTARQSVSTGE